MTKIMNACKQNCFFDNPISKQLMAIQLVDYNAVALKGRGVDIYIYNLL